MAPTLDDLLKDCRLTRLFSENAHHCALQLWVLQIKDGQSIENRIVYGRLVPYSFSSNKWSSSEDDNFDTVGHVSAQIIRLNLYVQSVRCADLLQKLSANRTISAISEELKLELPDQFKERFGMTTIGTDVLVYRPVAYLLNRDAYEPHSLSSPHGAAGAFSASISRADKDGLFRLDQEYDVALTASVIKHLNADTGLDFGGVDMVRFGDLELLVFPALDEREQRLLSVNWADDRSALLTRFDSMQVPCFSGFQFHLSIANGGQVVHSRIAAAERNADGVFEWKFELSDQLGAMTDSTELEIFGFHDEHFREGTLCCRWRIAYIREINIQGNAVGHRASPVKFDWLEKTTGKSVSARVKAASTINRGNIGFANHIGGRDADPWVPVNRNLTSLFARLHPPKSDGWFFQHLDEGRLQFVEWFRALLAKHNQHQVVIFDPYFEDAGLGLVLLCAAPQADYIVFTSLPKPPKEGDVTLGESDGPTPSRINNLVASCEHNLELLKQIKLRIYGMKEGRLHDRYILIIGSDKLPVAGFNLSNSFQTTAKNYPLLVTPIPPDILLKVERYKLALVQEAEAAQSDGETENPLLPLLFDSAASPKASRRYESLRFLEKVNAGDVLSIWIGEPSLHGLSGDPLKERMAALGLLRDNSLALPETPGLRNCLDQQASDFADFTATWEVLGDVLAHSPTEEGSTYKLESEPAFLEFLIRFLNASFNCAYREIGKELAVMDAELFRKPIDALLHSPYHIDHLFHATKYVALTWPEYFAIKFLWWYAPDALMALAEAQLVHVPMEPQCPDAVRLSLLSQIVSEISLSVQFDISDVQRYGLVCSSNGLLQWMGLNAIERKLEGPRGIAAVLQLIAVFPDQAKLRTLGWMVQRAAGNPKKVEIYNGLVLALHEAMPTTISADELKCLVDSMRGHMRQLSWAEPWLFKDVVSPLLRNDRAKTDDACEIWVQELAALLGPELKHQSHLFDRAREGQTTNISAFLFAHSSPERQQTSLKTIQAILKRQRHVIQQPLASTSNWTRWDDALVVSMWILTFTRWGQYYLGERTIANDELEGLSRVARELAMVRPMDEWRSKSTGKQGELAAFLDQVEELLASSAESQNKL